ncbi:MAG: fasciclin domain-containing protein [Halofilum sp. (in: g-proteobacteria)]|nr:fasciclin domain-containing protein [Halofilum sp. (in: g-proteobacteria)]
MRAGSNSMSEMKEGVVDTAAASPDHHETLVAAVKAAGLVETLKSEGPFTVFAPTDAAFGKLPAGTVDTLLQPKNKDQLTAVLTYHVLAGSIEARDILNGIKGNGGTVQYRTVQKQPLTFRMMGDDVVVEDAKGGVARIAAVDLEQSNGVIHVIDGVLLPN